MYDAFAGALGTPVRVETTPRERWTEVFRATGFSDAAAASYARMTAVTLDEDLAVPEAPIRGDTTLWSYVAALVNRAATR